MLQIFACLFIFMTIIGSSSQADEKRVMATPYSETYRAAVVQYYPLIEEDGKTTVKANALAYDKIIEKAAKYDIDIIVFPEFGLSGLPLNEHHLEQLRVKMYEKNISMSGPHINVTSTNDTLEIHRSPEAISLRKYFLQGATKIPENGTNPCDSEDINTPEVMKQLSCAAQEAQMYIVVNLYELVECQTKCSTDSFLLYNSNIVFDREGNLIAHYRKYNIQGEPWSDQIVEPIESIFTPDFGIEFGILIGLDLLKYGVAQQYTKKYTHTHDIVLSTHPYDEMPFLNSKHDQGSFAYKENKNLMAAGFSRDGGSGIYVGRYGWLKAENFTWDRNYLMYADVPRIKIDDCRTFNLVGPLVSVDLTNATTKVAPDDVHEPTVLLDFEKDIRKYLSSNYMATKPIDLERDTFKERMCVGDVCCYFEIRLETNPADLGHELLYRYRAMVFNGPYRFADGSWLRIETCALIACAGDKEEDCGKDHRSLEKKNATTFNSILITRQAMTNGSSYFGPLVSTKYDGGSPMRVNSHYTFIDNINVHRKNFQYPYIMFVLVLLEPLSEIEIFGINGRRFDVPPPFDLLPKDDTLSMWIAIIFGIIVMLVVLVLACCYYWRKYFRTVQALPVEENNELLVGQNGIWHNLNDVLPN